VGEESPRAFCHHGEMSVAMTSRFSRAFAALAVLVSLSLCAARPAAAANKEHQQLMADIRMLQEQAQLLQNTLGTLSEALKALNARLDQQADVNRKSFADEKLLIDNLTKDLGVVREKVDDNNVRVGSLSQEVDALRQLVQQALARPVAPPAVIDPNGGPAFPGPASTTTSAALLTPTPPPAAIGTSPTKAWEQAYGDYAAGLYDLAVDGFTAFIRDFPKHDQADNAQFLIGRSYLQDAKNDKAVEAFDKVIRMYPNSNAIPDSYYLKGVALRSLRQMDQAREAWNTVVQKYPDSAAASLAKQALGTTKP
jgi:tol-pal system protein YbgF